MTKEYTSKDIKVLSDREHVRIRTSIYMGSMHPTEYKLPTFDDGFKIEHLTFVPAVLKSVGEIIDNSIDEFSNVYSKRHHLIIKSQPDSAEYTIKDNGRGIPIDKHETGRFTPEVVLASLRSGRNFEDNKKVGVIGQNGVGSSCVNFLSSEFEVIIHRDNKVYHQIFERGCEVVYDPIISKDDSNEKGTQITFKLDESVFEDVKLPDVLLKEKSRALAFTNPSVKISYNNDEFRYRKGLEDVVMNMMTKDSSYYKFEYKKDDTIIEFFVITGIIESEDVEMFTWLNSSMIFDGGICNTQFINSFMNNTMAQLEKEAKKLKCKISKNDIKENLLILGNVKISDPEFDSQSKMRLVGPTLKKEIDQMINDDWSSFTRKNKEWLKDVLDRAYSRYHTKVNAKAIEDHKKKSKVRVEGLIEANNRDRSKCVLFITEGLSAASEIQNVRNPSIHASLPLSGKINNVYNASPAELLQMGKIENILRAIGLVPGQKANINQLRYGKILISTDADPDGSDIFALLINLFYRYWPELFESEYILRLNAPNIVASKGKKRIHFPTLPDYNKVKEKYSGYEITYFKGLGSMHTIDWKMLLQDIEKYSIPIINDGNIGDVLKLLFSDDINKRKEWLTE